MSDYIPFEILIEILTRLPVKSLIRFSLVCKAWYALFRSPNFIASHLDQAISRRNRKKNPEFLTRHFDKNDKKEYYTLHYDEDSYGRFVCKLEFPFKSPIGYFRIVGSCNGLICLSNDFFGDSQTIILWNPSIRKWVTLPTPTKPQLPHMFVLGFGVDRTTDFKVVRIVYYKDSLYRYKSIPDLEVFSLSSRCWRKVSSDFPPYYMVEFVWSQAFLNGAVHWIAYNRSVDYSVLGCLIVLFDMSSEVFVEMMLPYELAAEQPSNLYITVYGDCLAVFNYDKRVDHTSFSLWVMKEYGVVKSWTRLVKINLSGMLEKTVGFKKNGEILLSQKFGELVSYDIHSGMVKDLGIVGSTRSFYADDYLESLILL